MSVCAGCARANQRQADNTGWVLPGTGQGATELRPVRSRVRHQTSRVGLAAGVKHRRGTLPRFAGSAQAATKKTTLAIIAMMQIASRLACSIVAIDVDSVDASSPSSHFWSGDWVRRRSSYNRHRRFFSIRRSNSMFFVREIFSASKTSLPAQANCRKVVSSKNTFAGLLRLQLTFSSRSSRRRATRRQIRPNANSAYQTLAEAPN
ncbi:hypothetical protein ACVWXN_006758 [Bradyrhizobium sp. i1.4.4]